MEIKHLVLLFAFVAPLFAAAPATTVPVEFKARQVASSSSVAFARSPSESNQLYTGTIKVECTVTTHGKDAPAEYTVEVQAFDQLNKKFRGKLGNAAGKLALKGNRGGTTLSFDWMTEKSAVQSIRWVAILRGADGAVVARTESAAGALDLWDVRPNAAAEDLHFGATPAPLEFNVRQEWLSSNSTPGATDQQVWKYTTMFEVDLFLRDTEAAGEYSVDLEVFTAGVKEAFGRKLSHVTLRGLKLVRPSQGINTGIGADWQLQPTNSKYVRWVAILRGADGAVVARTESEAGALDLWDARPNAVAEDQSVGTPRKPAPTQN